MSQSLDADFLAGQHEFSQHTFGPGSRTDTVLDHIRSELDEVKAAPDDVEEWSDVILLAFDGALRAGHEPQDIIDGIRAKAQRNRERTWPDWRTADPTKRIEHVE